MEKRVMNPSPDDDLLTVEECWILESERRWERVLRGDVQTIDGEATLAALEARLT
jgi:hypothetical protein